MKSGHQSSLTSDKSGRDKNSMAHCTLENDSYQPLKAQHGSNTEKSLSSGDMAIILECKRLSKELFICEVGGLYEMMTSKLLSTKNMNSNFFLQAPYRSPKSTCKCGEDV